MKADILMHDGELRRLLEEIRAGLAGASAPLEPERLVFALRFEELGRGCVSWRLARAQRELARLHVRELARLLREAVALRLAAEDPVAPLDADSFRAWRACFREELVCAARDSAKATSKLHAMFARMRSEDPCRWPLASEIARASLALHDHAAARATLGEAWLCEGRTADAAAMFVDVLAGPARPRTLWRALDGLARVRRALGRDAWLDHLRHSA